MSRFNRSRNAIYNINYHIIFIPKYRKSILIGKFKNIIESALLEKAVELKINIEKYEIMNDNVHLFIKCKPTHMVSNIVKQLKGYSSYMLRKRYPKYKLKYKHFWSPSYYCESIGHISEDTIKRYIDEQRKII
jgi:putative transposase